MTKILFSGLHFLDIKLITAVNNLFVFRFLKFKFE
jgi:hypothetical protein